jgi:flagellar biosynthesis protein FlhG
VKPLDVQTHYETLEIPINATPEQIERAYRMVRGAYEHESLALYSVFDDNDAEVIRERIDLAYRILSDSESRREYDRGVLGRLDDEPEGEGSAEMASSEPTAAPDPQPLPPIEAYADIADEEAGSAYDGSRLRRARMSRGVEIDQIAAITKINPSYLRFIEDDAYDDLPAPVYVRGFVSAYARAIGLDGAGVASGYLARMEEARSDRRPSRLLGRR